MSKFHHSSNCNINKIIWKPLQKGILVEKYLTDSDELGSEMKLLKLSF